MALINRISRLFKADFHAVLDQIEEPELLLKQAIRDMEDELTATERRIASRAHEQATLSARSGELEQVVAEISGQLDLCFESDKPDLARNLIRKKLEATRLLKQLNTKSIANGEYLKEQQSVLDENSAALSALKQKSELFSHRATSRSDAVDNVDDVTWLAREMTVGDEEVEIAFLREQSLRTAS